MASIRWIDKKPYVVAQINNKRYTRRIPVTSNSAATRWLSRFNRANKIQKLVMLGEIIEPENNSNSANSLGNTFGDLFLQYCEYMFQTHRFETVQKKVSRFNVVWLPDFKYRLLEEITPGDVQKILSRRRGEGKAHNTIHNDAKVLKAFFTWAIEERYITDTPIRKLPGVQHKKFRLPTDQEIQDYLEFCPWLYYPIPAIAILCGLRKMEILNLDLQDLDFENLELNISPESSWKNIQGRTLPLRPDLAEILHAYIKETESDRTGDHLFLGRYGDRRRNIDKIHRKVREDAGLPWLTFHHFSHYFISALLKEGVPIEPVRGMAGTTRLELATFGVTGRGLAS